MCLPDSRFHALRDMYRTLVADGMSPDGARQQLRSWIESIRHAESLDMNVLRSRVNDLEERVLAEDDTVRSIGDWCAMSVRMAALESWFAKLQGDMEKIEDSTAPFSQRLISLEREVDKIRDAFRAVTNDNSKDRLPLDYFKERNITGGSR